MMKNAAGDAIILMKEPFVYEYIFRKIEKLQNKELMRKIHLIL